ncbi:hypothetical protein [Fodinibius sp.]|uniref:hypothetical protein n=1 Tax=Fodinibius sp. TaxID=1872440 RepID=UPI002ACD580F|nr:hypothetical protein [Fodinibius sp.]MDZ7660680.1 hypothetical protein [Fodinibius sp.]
MKTIHLILATTVTLFIFIACSSATEKENNETSFVVENVTISISSSNPDSTLIFEAINIGEWNGSAPADSQETPFEFTVSKTNFYGTFHKLKGNSSMILNLVAQKNGKTTWKTEKQFNHIAQVILDGNITSVNGK